MKIINYIVKKIKYLEEMYPQIYYPFLFFIIGIIIIFTIFISNQNMQKLEMQEVKEETGYYMSWDEYDCLNLCDGKYLFRPRQGDKEMFCACGS